VIVRITVRNIPSEGTERQNRWDISLAGFDLD
jgi:hypothetical protein